MPPLHFKGSALMLNLVPALASLALIKIDNRLLLVSSHSAKVALPNLLRSVELATRTCSNIRFAVMSSPTARAIKMAWVPSGAASSLLLAYANIWM